ncbi:hypothetical protein [Bacillus horti]|uniref:Glycosyltransferase n=1 Tax=Caldalkalibacillus horti TaxID=77523 RepID=A0ABT9W0F8_9BACI|nr:hypothetical protein [Bacillus horti]MDQ0166350.1 hypothetical protein [Bacillus horti]
MQTLLLWGLAVYGLTVLWTHMRILFYRKKENTTTQHYVLYTHNSQAKIEGTLRSLTQLAQLEGHNIYFYLIDCGSNDDTLKIIDRLEKSGLPISRLSSFPAELPLEHSARDELFTRDQSLHVVDLREGYDRCVLRTT